MSPINSRAKGKRGELQTTAILRVLWPHAHRSASQGAGGANAPDVESTPFWVESKCGARPNIYVAMEQALRDSQRGLAVMRPPLVVAHRTVGPLDVRTIISFRADDLVDVARAFAKAICDAECAKEEP